MRKAQISTIVISIALIVIALTILSFYFRSSVMYRDTTKATTPVGTIETTTEFDPEITPYSKLQIFANSFFKIGVALAFLILSVAFLIKVLRRRK